jgi:hypothetical protein
MANKLIFETLKAKEDKLQAKLDKLNKKDRVVRDAKTKALNDTLRSYFEGTEGIETNLVDLRYEPTYGSSMEITAQGTSYEKDIWNEDKQDYETKTLFRRNEICTVHVKEVNRYDNDDIGDFYTELGISTYSSSDKYSDFTLERMLFTGQVGMIIKDFKDDILADMNKVYEKHIKLTDKAWEKVAEVKKQINDIEDQRSKYKEDVFIEDLKNGIKLLEGKTAHIQERYDYGTGGVIAAKITRMSYSGKSADLEVQVTGRRWNQETEAYEDTVWSKDLDKVRVSNLKNAFLTGYNNITWERV